MRYALERIRLLSEKSYWTILIVGLVVFVSLTGFVLMPYQIVDYNLGINLITESIGILFAIVFLTWLFGLRQRLQWKSARDQLYKELGTRLSSIFRQILFLVDPKPLRNISETDFVRRLEELSKKSGEDFGRILELPFWLAEDDIIAIVPCWSRRDREFISMEIHHFQSFFNPELRVHMLDFLYLLGDLEFLLERRKEGYTTRERFFKDISYTLHAIVKEISEMNKLGIEISPFSSPKSS